MKCLNVNLALLREVVCYQKKKALLGFITGEQLMESIFFVSVGTDLSEYWYLHGSQGSLDTGTKQLL